MFGTILGMIIIGAIAGFVARALVPRDGVSGVIPTIVLGIIGSFVGGYVLNLAGVRLPIDNVWVSSIVTATIGALLVIVIARVVAK